MPDKGVKVNCFICHDEMYIHGVDEPAICPKCMNKKRTESEEIDYTGYISLFGGRNGKNS
jgi:hypothetical protein